MKVSQRGLYALKALVHLAAAYDRGGVIRIRTIAEAESIPEKFLEGILLVLRNARVVASQRGREGGYQLRRAPGSILVGDVVRLVDGPLAPFGDAVELRRLVKTEERHPGIYDLFLDVRDAASAIVDRTSLADLVARDRALLGARARRESRARRRG
jgi:Rrf2 family protein